MSDSAADLDLRLVRYFTAVAEHRHFGRAAEALHITQPSLSRQVRGLERQLGVRLLDRTPQGTRLTEAGEVFLPRARALLRSAAQAAAQTRAAAEPSRITIGYTNIIVTPAVRELRRRHPDADVRTVHTGWDEPRAVLLHHRVDAVVTRLPFPTDGLHVTVLYDEPRVLVVPLDHRLAGEESITLADIADEPIPRVPDSDPAWEAFWRVDPRPGGRPAPDGPVIEALEDKFELVAAGEAVAITARPHHPVRPDLTTIPIEDIDPSHVVLAVRAGDRNRLVADFRKLAQAHLTAPAG
ncbi:LysR family transcriptional regulator [Actinomadura algeriensis]|uniref:DNA-binding transcriptional LysR family regulator n=1 Tax=Actinomadura algeriensis TaxID=1679523 RepID=A0ABR9JKM1_9ACTN|nr:LysR substrate-binding domain-containing protein [Actinomadura algeriensis]MBE1531098.1 DNA-binding transcriptional LysR family regulator [Actinomadura algeriensis]